jgi:hypothetical protein
VLPEYDPLAPSSSLAQSFDTLTVEPAAKKQKTEIESFDNYSTSLSTCKLPSSYEVIYDDELSDTSEVTSASHYFKVDAVEHHTDPDTLAETTRYLKCKRSRNTAVHFENRTMGASESGTTTAVGASSENGTTTVNCYFQNTTNVRFTCWKKIHGHPKRPLTEASLRFLRARAVHPIVHPVVPSTVYEAKTALDDSPTDDVLNNIHYLDNKDLLEIFWYYF